MRRRRARASRPGWCTGIRASSSASIGRATRCSRPRSSPLAPTCSRPTQIRAEFARLQVIVDKTAGPREQEAMALLTEYVRSR